MAQMTPGTAPAAPSVVALVVAEAARATAAELLAAQKTANLSDLASAATARTNLQLGTAATHATGDYELAGAAAAEAAIARAAEAKAVPRWAPTTAYTAGQQVVSPNNDVVSRLTTSSSGATYDPAQWGLSATYAPRDSLYFSARNRPDGALATPLVSDSGAPYTLTHMGGAGFVVAGEALTAVAGLPYMNFGALSGKVREFTMTAKWTDAANPTDAPAVMIVSDGVFHETNDVSTYANAGGHTLIFRDHVNVMKRKGDGTNSLTYYQRTFPALAFDVWHTFTMRWDGKQAIFILPDGTSYEAGIDADVQAWWGRYACAEIVANVPTDNPVTIADFNVTSAVKPVTNDPARRKGRLIYRHETSGANINIPILAATTTLFSTAALVPVPASKKILIEGSLWIEELGPLAQVANSLFLGIQYGSGTYNKNLTVISGYTPISDGVTARAHGRLVQFSLWIDLSAFIPGERYAITVKGTAGAVSHFIFIDSGSASGGASTLRTSWLNVYEYVA